MEEIEIPGEKIDESGASRRCDIHTHRELFTRRRAFERRRQLTRRQAPRSDAPFTPFGAAPSSVVRPHQGPRRGRGWLGGWGIRSRGRWDISELDELNGLEMLPSLLRFLWIQGFSQLEMWINFILWYRWYRQRFWHVFQQRLVEEYSFFIVHWSIGDNYDSV